MLTEASAEDGGEPGEIAKLNRLKQFRSAGKGFWSNVSDTDWNDWRWQLKNRITSLEQLQRLMPTLTPEEHAGTVLANSKPGRFWPIPNSRWPSRPTFSTSLTRRMKTARSAGR
jgi:hypothetical protein